MRVASRWRESLVDDVRPLLWPTASPLLARARADAITARVHGLAWVFGMLTLAFVPVDAMVFPLAEAVELGIARLAASLAFIGIAERTRDRAPSVAGACVDLGMLFAVLVAFFVASRMVLAGVAVDDAARAYQEVTALAPLVMAAGLSLFPLVAAESLVVGVVLVLLQSWHLEVVAPLSHPGLYWVLALVALVAAVAGMTQVSLINAMVARASHDALTHCLRRDSGLLLLRAQLDYARRQRLPLAILFADLDHFKRVNDRFGHEAGDRVLAVAAAALGQSLRRSDFVVRWGGEEFLVVLPGADKAEAVNTYRRVREGGIGKAPDGEPVTLSVGVAEYREDGVDDAASLVDLADRRMYAAKEGGRDTCVTGGPAPAGAPQPAR